MLVTGILAGPFSHLDDTIFQYHIYWQGCISFDMDIAELRIILFGKPDILRELSIFSIYGNQERHANFDNTFSTCVLVLRLMNEMVRQSLLYKFWLSLQYDG